MKMNRIMLFAALVCTVGCSEASEEENTTASDVTSLTDAPQEDVAEEPDTDAAVGESEDGSQVESDTADIPLADTEEVEDTTEVSTDTENEDAEEEVQDAEEEDGSNGEEEDTLVESDTSEESDTAGPEPTGNADEAGMYAFETNTQSVSVTPLGTIEVSSYTPQGDGPWPLLVFAPGFQLAAVNFNWVGEHLASHGIAVLIPTFGDSFLAPIDHVDLALGMRSLLDLAIDTDGPLGGNVDSFSMAVGGHSRGGKVAILAAIQDARIQSVITLDPVDSVGGPFSTPSPENPSVAPELMAGLDVPSGYVGAGQGAEGIQPCAPQEDNYSTYYAAAGSPSYQWVLPNAGHNDFATDLDFFLSTLCPSNESPENARNFSRGVLLAFLSKHLLDSDAHEGWMDGTTIPSGVEFSSK